LTQSNNKRKIIYSKLLIAADGVNSIIGKKAGLDTHLEAGELGKGVNQLIENIDIDPNKREIYFSREMFGLGVGWVFPKGERKANIGLCVSRTDKLEPKKQLKKFINFKNFQTGKKGKPVLGKLPIARPIPSFNKRLMVIGDAGRLCNSLTGGGLENAILSGKVAGSIAAKAIQQDNFSSEFLNNYFEETEIKTLINNLCTDYNLMKKFQTFDKNKLIELGKLARSENSFYINKILEKMN
jgi:digeranylgeranylglycerophospholipid reductase